jgi:hypothetical protein
MWNSGIPLKGENVFILHGFAVLFFCIFLDCVADSWKSEQGFQSNQHNFYLVDFVWNSKMETFGSMV